LWGSKIHQERLIDEDRDCLRNWENYILLDRLPHELGLEPECYLEDIESIKQMKRWMQKRQEREQKKQEALRRMHSRMKGGK
jgi:hypothetical protein